VRLQRRGHYFVLDQVSQHKVRLQKSFATLSISCILRQVENVHCLLLQKLIELLTLNVFVAVLFPEKAINQFLCEFDVFMS
jgi:hypothetical protein